MVFLLPNQLLPPDDSELIVLILSVGKSPECDAKMLKGVTQKLLVRLFYYHHVERRFHMTCFGHLYSTHPNTQVQVPQSLVDRKESSTVLQN